MSLYRPVPPVSELPLFSQPTEAHARKSDPQTSHQAAARTRRTTLQSAVIACLRRHPDGLTSHEIADALDASLVAVSPRMRPLCRAGEVIEAGTRDGRTVWQVAA